jgi:hypothetical protein
MQPSQLWPRRPLDDSFLVGSEHIYRREERRSLNRVVELGHPKEKCPRKANSEASISTPAAGIR